MSDGKNFFKWLVKFTENSCSLTIVRKQVFLGCDRAQGDFQDPLFRKLLGLGKPLKTLLLRNLTLFYNSKRKK